MSEINSFKNRIYKLSTGEKVNAEEMEKLIKQQCHYVQYLAVGADENENPVALIFPNQKLMENPDYKLSPEEGCFCPRNLDELGRCLTGCLKLVNHAIEDESSKIKSATIINKQVPTHQGTPFSLQVIFNRYKNLLHEKHGEHVPADKEIYFIKNAQ